MSRLRSVNMHMSSAMFDRSHVKQQITISNAVVVALFQYCFEQSSHNTAHLILNLLLGRVRLTCDNANGVRV